MSPASPGAVAVLAAAGTDQLPEDVGKSGPLGLVLTLLLLIAVVFLVRSMSKHLKRIPASFDPEDDLPPVPDTPPELLGPQAHRTAPGEDLLDRLRRAPRAIEPPRPDHRPEPPPGR